jgi:hypothetical protein
MDRGLSFGGRKNAAEVEGDGGANGDTKCNPSLDYSRVVSFGVLKTTLQRKFYFTGAFRRVLSVGLVSDDQEINRALL